MDTIFIHSKVTEMIDYYDDTKRLLVMIYLQLIKCVNGLNNKTIKTMLAKNSMVFIGL
jgi:hypothetical protein